MVTQWGMEAARCKADIREGNGPHPPFPVKWLLVIGVIVVVLFAAGGIHFEFYSTSEPASAGASDAAQPASPSIGAPPASSRLGSGVRAAAVLRWLRRMNALCALRNRRETAVPSPGDTTHALARYAAQTLWIWDDYRRRASTLRVPGSYAAESGWLQEADAAKGAAIQSVLDAARSDDRQASHSAIFAFQNLSSITYRTYVRIGLTACGRFHP